MIAIFSLALAVWLTVRRGLAPLERIAHQVEERSAESLAPLPAAGTPDEVKSLVGALNRLLERLGHALETQRAFVADAAHECRPEALEAFTGKTETIRMPTSVTCEVCAGSGAKAGSKPKTCPTCAGCWCAWCSTRPASRR